MVSLYWLVQGYGNKITSRDVQDAYEYTMAAAANAGCADETHQRIRTLVAGETYGERFITRVLRRHLGL